MAEFDDHVVAGFESGGDFVEALFACVGAGAAAGDCGVGYCVGVGLWCYVVGPAWFGLLGKRGGGMEWVGFRDHLLCRFRFRQVPWWNHRRS